MTDRDHFAAAALTGLLHHNHEPPKPVGWWVEQAYDYADAMLRERERTFDAKPRELSDDQRTLRNAAGVLGPGGFKNLANELLSLSRRLTNLDASPEATAVSGPPGNPVASAVIGTGKQPAPPSVETDGFSPGSRPGQINRTPERQSPDRECGESSLRDVPQLDNSRAAGGPEQNTLPPPQPTLTDAEREAVRVARDAYADDDGNAECEQIAAVLSGLLERTK